jgi:hypothetical protein
MLRQLLKDIFGYGYFKSYSQFGEDAVLRLLLPPKGRYIDVGCYHPKLYSNTYALYRRGWSGIAIDPNKKAQSLFKIFRPRDRFVCAAIGQGTASYSQFRDAAYNKLAPGNSITLMPLSAIVDGPFDFLNVDCEGWDRKVLQSYNWKYKPRVICTEEDCADILGHHGYKLFVKLALSSIYVRPDE